MSLTNTAIIGKLPGYNKNIDADGEFQKNLLKGITYIDFFPASYKAATNINGAANIPIDELLDRWSDQILKSPALFERETEKSVDMLKSVLERMYEEYTFLGSNFSSIEKIRIVAANDSTFTETFNNNYDNSNGIQGLFNTVKNSKMVQWGQMYAKGMASMSHATLLETVGKAGFLGQENNLATLLKGAAFSMNLAAPLLWNSSQYNSSLTVFIKLISPVGTPECIQRNILKPLMYLLAASSPVTSSGLLTGVPMLWEVQAQGVTNFRLGAINSMSVIRGSFETTFNTELQPTIVDVRLGITPLLTDFAVQSQTSAPSIYQKGNAKYFGVQNPSDISRGTLNTNGDPEKVITIKI